VQLKFKYPQGSSQPEEVDSLVYLKLVVSASPKGSRSLGKNNMEFTAIPPQDVCYSNCKTLLDLRAPRSKRPFWRTLSHLIDLANECNICAFFYEGLSLEFELDVDIISDIHLDDSEVNFYSHDSTVYSTMGPSLGVAGGNGEWGGAMYTYKYHTISCQSLQRCPLQRNFTTNMYQR